MIKKIISTFLIIGLLFCISYPCITSYAKDSQTLEGFLYKNDKHFYKKKEKRGDNNLSERATFLIPEFVWTVLNRTHGYS